MKKMLVAVILCVMMAGFVFAGTPDSDVDVALSIGKYAELSPETQSISWYWDSPSANDVDQSKTVTISAFYNFDVTISVDKTNVTLGNNIIVSHNFSDPGYTGNGTTDFDVIFDIAFPAEWWTEGATLAGADLTDTFTFTIAAL